MKTKQPTQRNYHWLSKCSTIFFDKLLTGSATTDDYYKIGNVYKIYCQNFGKMWTKKVMMQSANIVFGE